ncbi:MAG: hypothetical protein IKA85_03365 [Clostridia bacterium]|nr:hypothetical protein [Clostridia bacterium]
MLEGEEYCDVCKAELKIGPQLMFSANDEINEQVLCPICKVKYIGIDEEMCSKCREKLEYEKNNDIDVDKDDEWRQYLDDDEKDVAAIEDEEELLLSQIEEEEALNDDFDEEDEDIDPYTNEKISKDKKSDDDFDYISIDESDFEDYDEEEDEEEEDED